ncbi:MAG: hypothetical protein JSR27_01815 [Proteobacteria bacterium]|nr:hypothetical protein [Pseudomonadota bacterium]
MRRSTAKAKNLAGAIGLVLSLPLSFAAAAERPHADVPSLAAYAQSASILDAWRDYALADLTRGFDWADNAGVAPQAPSLFDRGIGRIAQPASHFSATNAASPISVTFLRTKAADTPLFVAADQPSLLRDFTPGLQRYLLAPSYAQRWGDNSSFSVSAIFAYQRFAGLGLGIANVPLQSEAAGASITDKYPGSYGTGMRLDFVNRLGERVSWQAGVQSRVNMDAFNNYRGVYSEPGSFDIPASVNIGVGFALAPGFTADIGAERVMYSGIAPFTSAALPTRFLVLLGSSISPAFAWQNLDVYSAGFSWSDPANGVWSLHYTTREQPLPTSPLLQAALEPYLASHNVEFGFMRAFGTASSLHFAASYAPSEFVLGVPTSNTLRNAGNGGQIEYQLLWATRF